MKMFDHISFVLISFIYVCRGVSLTKPNGDLDNVSVARHILALEQTVSELQSQFQAQEQKQAAVLSSVLSKLATTTDELVRVNSKLEELEGRHNATTAELSRVNNELKDLSGVKTELTELRKEHDVILEELTTTKSDLNATSEELLRTKAEFMSFKIQTNATHLDRINGTDHINPTQEMFVTNSNILKMLEVKHETDVAYEVVLPLASLTVHINKTLKFPKVLYNRGGAYNTTSGIFTASVSGTYMFWAQIMTNDDQSLYIAMYKEEELIGRGYAPGGHLHGTASILTVIGLNEGDQVWLVNMSVTKSVRINGNKFSSYGGALLHAHNLINL